MQYKDEVIFVKHTGKHYDPDLGKDIEEELIRTKRLAHIVSPSMKTSTVVFGDLKQDDIVVHLKQPYENTYDYCLIKLFNLDEREYFFVTQKRIDRRQIILMSGEHNERKY